jgi:hypothetical protein
MPDNQYGSPYVRGPITPNVGSITTTPLTTDFPGLRSGRALSQDDRINMMNGQINPNDVKPGKTYLSDVAGDLTGRYDTVVYGANNENAWGQQQSWLAKGTNGILKGTNLAATTVVGGFATVGGAVSAIFTGRLADIWDNPVMQGIDKWNNKVDQEYLPNYYTDTEKNADWYSRDNWMTANFLFDKVIKNSGFAVGAVISGNMASKALGLAGTAIGEAAASRALAMEASQSFKSFAPLLKNTARAFSVGKNAEAAAILEKEITSIADVAERTSKLAEIAKQTNQFAKINDVGKRIGIATYSQGGESAFEGLQTSNEFRNQLIEQHKRGNFGVAPNSEELKKIDQQTEKVGKTSFLANMALLTATEYVQLPKLMGSSYAAERQAANSLAGVADNVVLREGKYVVEEAAKTKFGKLYNRAKGVGKYVFDPKEMGQEIGQYAVQVGTQNYYNKAFQGKDANILVDGVLYGLFGEDDFGRGVGALNSKEGIEGGIIGGLTGGVMQAKGNYLMGKATKTNTSKFLEQLNNAPTYKEAFQYKLDAVNRGVALQEEQEDAIIQGDELEAKDINSDMMHNYLSPRIKYGRMDMVMDDIYDMRQTSMSPEGLTSLKQLGLANENDTAATFNARLTNFETTAKNTEQIYKSTNLRYSGELLKDKDGQPVLNAKGEQLRKYSDASIEQMIYAASKVANYDVRIPQVSALPAGEGIDVQSIVNEELTNPESTALADKLAELDTNPEVNTAEVKQNLIDSVELAMRRKEYLKNYNDIISNPEVYNEERKEFEGTTEGPKETITIKTKKGERNIEIGTEYFLGKVTGKSKEDKDVYRAPRLVVLGRNEDGTIKVQDSDGKIHDLKESTLEKYNLGKVETTLKNRKAKFYMEHWNTVYEFNFGTKTGGKQKGRIEYDPETNKMLFIYNNKKGERKEIEVTGDQFEPKKGFKEPMIKSVGELTAVQQKALTDFVAEKDPRIDAKREARLAVLNELFDTLAGRQERLDKTIEQKQQELTKAKDEYAALEKEIEEAQLDKRTKTVKFKAATTRALENAMRLSRMQEQLEREIEDLKTDSEEIEFTLNYITDMASNIDEYSTNFKDFMDELQDEIVDLEILQETTQKQIAVVSKLSRDVQAALDSTIDYLSKLISSFESKYPNVPRLMGQDWVDFLKDNPNFLKIKANYRSDLQMIDDIVAEMEDGEVAPNEERLKDLTDHLAIMQASMDEVQKEIEAKEIILNKFKQIADKYKQQQAEDKRLQNDQALRAEYLGTNSDTVQSFFGKESYEASAKKNDLDLVSSTVAVTKGKPGEQIREHHARANRFGFNMYKFENRSSIRGVVVTAKTQDSIIPGLTDLLTDGGRALGADGKPINPNTIVALVMVQDNEDGTMTLVDENGVPFNKEQLADPTKYGIFQVFPSAELEANYKDESGKSVRGSMFRKSTKDYIQTSLKEQYAKWRNDRLQEDALPEPQDISSSFGIPDYVTRPDEKGKEVRDYNARVAVEATGLLEEGALIQDPVLMVATTNESVSYGKVTFETPKGRVFLKVPGGLVKLKNRQFTEKEANTIFDVIHQITKNSSKDGTVKTKESQYLLNWLKSVVYWGIAKNTQTGERKDAGYNNIWFETTTEGNKSSTKLYMSGLQTEGFDFTPTGLENKKSEIIAILQGMYNNVNATKVNVDSFKKKYTEIVGIDENGQPIKKDWDNYQSYLLSSEGRINDDIPLVTQIRPLTDPAIPNKKGIYFTLDSTSDDYQIPAPPVVATAAPKPAVATTSEVAVVAPNAVAKVYNLEGETNDYKLGPYGNIPFKLDAQKFIDTKEEEGFSITFEAETMKALMSAKDIDETTARDVIYAAIVAKLRPQLDAFQTKSKIPAADAPQTTFVLDGVAENTIQIGSYGKIIFTLDGEKFNETGEGFNIQFPAFDSEVLRNVMAAKSITQAEAQQLIGNNIYAKVSTQLEALNIPSEPAIATPFTPTVEAAPEMTTEVTEEGEAVVEPVVQKPAGVNKFASRQRGQTPDDSSMRVALAKQAKKFQGEDWAKLEEGIKKMLPNVPLYRVKNIIQATNGKQAWGMLHQGAIYVYENAEVGTVYHEVFEAVWKMFADAKEKEAVLKEFASRPGTFVDRETGKTVAYKNATAHQIKEELAEEFRDAVLKDKLGEPIASKSLIGRLFSQLIDFIKSFFTGDSAQRNTKELFNKIGNGYYATYNPYVSQLAYANSGVIDIENATADTSSDLRVKNIPAVQLHEIIEEMTFITLKDLIDRKESLFDIVNPRQKELYEMLQVRILDVIGHQADLVEDNVASGATSIEDSIKQYNDIEALYNNVYDQWDNIIKEHKAKLKTFNIEFDENDELILGDEDASGKSDWQDARKIDSFRKSNGAIKLLLGTLPISHVVIVDGERVLKNTRSSIGGAILMPADEVFIKLKNKLYDSVDPDDMLSRLRDMAKGDPTYENLYKRLTKVGPAEDINFKALDQNGIQLLSAFWKAMKSQNADAISVFILPSGEVVVSDSTLTSSAKQAKRDMTNTMIDKIKSDSTYFSYDPKTGRYFATDKIRSMVLNGSKMESYTALLKELGIDFDIKALKKLNDNQLENFRDAVEGIQNEFIRLNEKGKAKTQEEVDADEANGKVARGIASLAPRALGIEGRLFQLGLTQALIDNKGFESTYFNMNGERTQTYIGVNTLSNMHNVLSKLDNIDELSSNPAYSQYKYLRTDAFAKGSVMLQNMFNLHPTKGTGKRIFGTEDLMKSEYIDGTDNQRSGKKKESSKLTAKERIVQEINLNLDGYFLNLVPGDASIEWAVKMLNFIDSDSYADDAHLEIFKNYFLSEVELARDGRFIVEGKGNKSTDLRFFKAILGDKLNNEITKTGNQEYTALELYEGKPSVGFKGYKGEIDAAVNEFIKKDALDTETLLRDYGVVGYGAEGLEITDIVFDDNVELTEASLKDNLQVLSINYMIANIEMHKLLYSDPYQYSDELKRIKNFNSPRQALMAGSQDINSALDAIYNKGYNPGDAGYTDMTNEFFRSVTLGDVMSASDLKGYDPYEETDGGGYISLKANRIFGIRSGEWTKANEAQYRHDIAFEELVKSGATVKEIEKFDRNSPDIASTYTPRKPIVSGNKDNGRDYNDVVMHKFALLPLSFRLLYKINPESNAIKLYNKMQRENIDYTVYASGSKVGTEKVSPLYNDKGEFDETPFEDASAEANIYEKQAVSNIPFAIMGVQAEVPSKEAAYVTQGSQITKLATMDFMEAGVPIDFDSSTKDFNTRFVKWIKLSDDQKSEQSELYKEIKHNQEMLQAKIEYGYKSLLKKLGLKQTSKGFEISNIKKLTDTLRDEILKREVNYNITDALDGFEKGDTVLEATPAYQQIRNILYSIADKNVVSPKISGGMKVQIPGTLLESKRPGKQIVKGKNVYSSDLLRFYTRNENGKTINVCQIMIARWFKSDMSDEELMDYFNNTEEGRKEFAAITGVAFRIPTQKQNSIDVFEIGKFLPEGYKDSVVIPSELVKKAGSDFDIDKLSIYLKNLYTSNDGKPKQVPYLGTGQEAIDKFGELYNNGEFNEYLKSKKDALPQGSAEDRLFESMFPEEYSLQREDVINDLYRQSLENEYISSLQNLISNDLNFDNLIKPNSADDLKKLSKDINEKLGKTEIDYGAVGNMLSRGFMTSLRHAFVTGKYAIGIAAVNQTNHAQNQRSPIFIDPTKLKTVIDPIDEKWLGNGQINFQEYNSMMVDGVKRATLSMIKSADKKTFISDTIGQFIDGYVDISKGPWIMEMGASPNVASTWMLLVKLGVPINTVGYFMNQPVVREYLKTIQNNGYSWLFIDKFVDNVKYDYIGGEDVEVTSIPSEKELFEMVGKSAEDMSPTELAQQQFILDEFLKYAMMANHLFQVTQGSNFDTATINDPYLVTKKRVQLEKARNTIFSSVNKEGDIIAAVDSILDNSFIGPLAEVIYGVRDAFAEVLISDRKNIRKVMESVLIPYADLNDRDFIKVSQKAVNDLFDWAVQNNRKLNNSVKKILLGTATEKSAAREIIEFRDKVLKDKNNPLFNNLILKSIQLESGSKIVLDEYELRDGNTYKRENISVPLLVKLGYSPKESRKMMNMMIPKVDNLSIKGRDGKVYDQNLIIYAFNELKEKLGDENKDLYGKLVRLAVIQSGLTNSPIAFTNLLPYEDFREFYNETLSNLENIPNLADFRQLDIMERSNWNNTNITMFKKGRLQQSKKNSSSWYYPERQFLSKKLESKMLNGELPPMIVFSMFSPEGKSDFVVYSSEGKLTKAQRIKARRTSDTSHVEKGLFKKVYTVNENGKRVPLIQESEYKGKFYFNYVYKAVNAWGDSFKAQEFYGKTFPLDPLSTVSRASVLDNGFIKVQKTINAEGQQLSPDEVEDSAIELALLGTTPIIATIQPVEEVITPAAETRERSTVERTLKDGNAYNIDDIKLGMLIKMGYTPSEVGEILKEIRKEIC